MSVLINIEAVGHAVLIHGEVVLPSVSTKLEHSECVCHAA